MAMLTRWSESGDESVERACVYALASLDTPQSLTHLARIAESDLHMAPFARWYVTGKRNAATPAAGRTATPTVQSSAASDVEVESDDDMDAPAVWPSDVGVLGSDRALIALVRANLDACGPEVAACLGSDDPQDRLLGLRIVDGAPRAADFRENVVPLADDPVEAVRERARALLQEIDRQVASAGAQGDKAAASAPADDKTVAIRRELRRAMARLLAEPPDAERTADLVRQIQALSHQLSGKPAAAAAHPAAETEAPK